MFIFEGEGGKAVGKDWGNVGLKDSNFSGNGNPASPVGASLEKATCARFILCCIAVSVGLLQETWDPKYLLSVAVGTVEPSEKCSGVALVFGCSRCSVLLRLRDKP